MHLSATVMPKMPSSKPLELRILQLYIWALAAPKGGDVQRTASLARHGSYEVRLFEPEQTPHSDAIPFWIELFDHETKAALDSYGGYDLAETVAAAEALISQAKSLHLHSAPRAKPSIQ